MSKKQTEKKTIKPNKSKYQIKLRKRRKAALDLELPTNTPWPIIWINQKQNKE